MTKRESGVECVLTRGRCGQRNGISHARLHLHILLRIVARLAANRKMRHRQTSRRRSTDREREMKRRRRERERERESKEEICMEQCWQILRAKIGLILKAKIAKNCMQKSRKKASFSFIPLQLLIASDCSNTSYIEGLIDSVNYC